MGWQRGVGWRRVARHGGGAMCLPACGSASLSSARLPPEALAPPLAPTMLMVMSGTYASCCIATTGPVLPAVMLQARGEPVGATVGREMKNEAWRTRRHASAAQLLPLLHSFAGTPLCVYARSLLDPHAT